MFDGHVLPALCTSRELADQMCVQNWSKLCRFIMPSIKSSDQDSFYIHLPINFCPPKLRIIPFKPLGTEFPMI